MGFDIERRPYPAQLVLQDVLTLHGSQFRNAAVIVASPPCQAYSYLAMPWSRSKSQHSQKAKAMRRKWETEGPDNRLFDACFRIQREACEAAGRFIPLIVENVRGAQPWVGRAAWSYGSFFLWGDVPALMPIRFGGGQKFNPDGTNHGQGSWFKIADSKERGQKCPGMNFHDYEKTGKPGRSFQTASVALMEADAGIKRTSSTSSWFGDYQAQKALDDAIKQGGDGGMIPKA